MVFKFSEPEKSWAGWIAPGVARPLFPIGKPCNGQEAQPGNGQMVALLAGSREAVDRTHGQAWVMGASCEGLPDIDVRSSLDDTHQKRSSVSASARLAALGLGAGTASSSSGAERLR